MEENEMKFKSLISSIVLLVGLHFLVEVNNGFAGTTGKLAGRLTDSETGEALPGSNVILESLSAGAATDLDGNYVIINIPPGMYTIRATMMGYKDVQMKDVRIRVDMTTTINFKMSPTVLDAGEQVTVVAERPLVQMDMTGSLSAVGADEIANLPVQSITDVLELQAGIVRSGNDLHIRGGRAGEVAYWIDGIAITDVFSGGSGVTVENSAVQELQVISGTFNAEYGQAMAGIINTITKEGGNKYQGQIKAYVGDYISNDKHYDLLNTVTPVTDLNTGVITTKTTSDNQVKDKFNKIYNLEANLNGPVPFLSNKLSFFANVRYNSTDGHLYGRNWFTPQGNPGDSSIVPMNPYQRISTQAKLTYRLNPSIKLSYNLFYNKWKNDRIYSQAWTYCPESQPQQFGGGTTHILTLNHVLTPSTFYELRFNHFYNEYERYLYKDPTKACKYLVHVYADTTYDVVDHTFDFTTPEGAAELATYKLNRVSFDYIIAPDTPKGYVNPSTSSAPTSNSFNNIGTNNQHYNRSTAYWVGKLDLTSQITNKQQIKAGVEYRDHELKLYQYDIKPAVDATGQQITPYQPSVPSDTSIYASRYDRKPKELSAYIQDKIELKNIIFNVGLRFDYFDANSVIIVDPEDPDIYSPRKESHIWKDKANGIKYTTAERRALMQKASTPNSQISPRLGIAYPITDQGVIHFSYGHFFQIPEFQYLYDNPDFKVGQTGGNYVTFGNANLKPQKTAQYEIGIQQQLTQNVGIDVTVFYRDVRDWVGAGIVVQTARPAVNYALYENKDYENVRGVTVKLEKRYSSNFSARIDYSYQISEGTYSSPIDAFNDAQANREPRKSLIAVNWDQNHTLNGSIVYRANDWTISMIGRYWSGRPYSPSFTTAQNVGGSAGSIGLNPNSERLPNQKSVDLNINKLFKLSGMELELFMNVYNLFDIRNKTAVYGDTGSSEYTTTIDPSKISYNSSRIGTVEDFVNQPSWYSEPREIQVGLTIGF
jgi:hypothetical protein